MKLAFKKSLFGEQTLLQIQITELPKNQFSTTTTFLMPQSKRPKE